MTNASGLFIMNSARQFHLIDLTRSTSFRYLYVLSRETAVIREEDETPNDRNDRGEFILVAHRLRSVNNSGMFR